MQRELVERAMAGDRDAFAELQRGSIDKLYAIARLILRDSDRAQDATQEAFIAAWRRLPGLRDPDAHRVVPRCHHLTTRASPTYDTSSAGIRFIPRRSAFSTAYRRDSATRFSTDAVTLKPRRRMVASAHIHA